MWKRNVKAARKTDWADADLSKARRLIFPNLKPTREAISLRVPTITLDKVRRMANRAGVPYQSLINAWITERADEELAKTGSQLE
jgi:predicted DNA binding CopG/RHH family protein